MRPVLSKSEMSARGLLLGAPAASCKRRAGASVDVAPELEKVAFPPPPEGGRPAAAGGAGGRRRPPEAAVGAGGPEIFFAPPARD
jgi:hypothetical protein